MPYTPPSQQSPASSKSNSPAVSRSSSYHQDDIPRSPQSTRPQPPRSHSSASYLHKHRRSPSITKLEGAPPKSSDPANNTHATDFAALGSLRQSPPPVNNLLIPTGAVLSPPDSSENSDGDEGNAERGRELEKNWDQLQEAVRAIPQQRESSPNKSGECFTGQKETQSEPHSQSTSPTALSTEARKISHSRSATETKIVLKKPSFAESPTHTDDSDEDADLLSKPALVRKKSGELVKPALRPSSRRRYSSMPGTPTYSKSVHFNDSDNQTRHFLQVDKPIAVSAGSSPVETYDSESEFPFSEDEKKPELEIKVANFPEDTYERKTKPVRVERLFLSSDKSTLVGVVAVQNISFHKQVVARFTLDYWKTTSEVAAEYNNDVRNPPTDGCDRFNFHIRLADQANIASKTLLLCIRYSVDGTDHWDNNDNTNYQIDFSKGEAPKKTKQVKPVQSVGLGQRPLTAIPRSRHTPPSSRGKPESIDDDFAARFDSNTGFSFGSPNKILGDATIKLKQKPKRSSLFGPPSAPTNGLGSRYDFGSSLSAALTSSQDKGPRQSAMANSGGSAQQRPADGYFGPQDRTEPAKVDPETERPDAITTDRPAMGSDQYKDLVQKFCYFSSGPGKGVTQTDASTSVTSQPRKAVSNSDGVSEDMSGSSSTCSSGSGTPTQQLDGVNDRVLSAATNHFTVRSGSPASFTGQSMSARSASPVSFGYPYHSSHRDGYLSDTPAPTAIQG